MEPILTVQNVSWERPLEPGSFVLREVSLNIRKGESAAIVGRSGRGKSTLLRLMAGLEVPTTGAVRFAGALVTEPPVGLGIVFQDFEETVFDWLTVRENILLGAPEPFGPEHLTLAERLADELGLKEHLLKPSSRGLSGGERQRVAIARTLLHGAEMVLLDEPFSSLDTVARYDLIKLLRRVTAQHGTTFLIISHDIEEALWATDRVYCLLHARSQPQLREFDPRPHSTAEDDDTALIMGAIRVKAERIAEILRGDANER